MSMSFRLTSQHNKFSTSLDQCPKCLNLTYYSKLKIQKKDVQINKLKQTIQKLQNQIKHKKAAQSDLQTSLRLFKVKLKQEMIKCDSLEKHIQSLNIRMKKLIEICKDLAFSASQSLFKSQRFSKVNDYDFDFNTRNLQLSLNYTRQIQKIISVYKSKEDQFSTLKEINKDLQYQIREKQEIIKILSNKNKHFINDDKQSVDTNKKTVKIKFAQNDNIYDFENTFDFEQKKQKKCKKFSLDLTK